MGQAWCKEKSTKAQDSKSPLDRVFVRCAHRIYPGLKEEGSVLGGVGGGGGATQRVTSSEIGYAGSPPRASLLQRGQSIDSVDRPFHPSDWVDVNLEVPCTPRASVIQLPPGARRADDPATTRANGTKSNGKEKTPVPPPRRRRRTRDRRPLPPKPGFGDTADEESEAEPEPLYSKLTSKPRPVQPELQSADELDGPDQDSDDEFEAIERSLEKSSQDELSTSPETCEKANHAAATTMNARPKNHSSTSLPNVAELLAESGSSGENPSTAQDDAAAKRPPRHVKTASLPRDTSLCAPQTPERTVFPKRPIEADAPDTSKAADNSIFEELPSSADCSQLGFEADVETSTPVKSPKEGSKTRQESNESREETFESCTEASKSRVEAAGVPAIPHDVDRPASAAAAAAAGDESRRSDVGYESRSPQAGSHPFSDGSSESRARLFADDDDESGAEMSSGILRDAIIDSANSSQLEHAENHVAVVGMLQRTISEESLPHEMLVDGDLDEEEEEEKSVNESKIVAPEEKSSKDASNQLTRQTSANGHDSFKTPPPTPERPQPTSNGPAKPSDTNPFNLSESPKAACQPLDDGSNNPASMTPSLMELEAALTDMLERKDEAERDGEDNEEAEVSSPEPQIVPVGGGGGGLRRLSPQSERKRERELAEKRADRPIDFHIRQNPFNDLLDDCSRDHNSSMDDPPEKPHRLHRVSLIEDSNIEEPLIVPTPPRRRHRSKSSNFNSSGDSATIPALHTYASGDRLI